MNITSGLLTFALASFIVTGCESYRDNTRGALTGMGAIQLHDLARADACRKALPEYLGLPKSHIQIEAGAGVTHVTIPGKDLGGKQAVIGKVQEFTNANDFGPIQL